VAKEIVVKSRRSPHRNERGWLLAHLYEKERALIDFCCASYDVLRSWSGKKDAGHASVKISKMDRGTEWFPHTCYYGIT
jgi:hypothetical protein